MSLENQVLGKLFYKGEKKFFNIETRYGKMTQDFNNLANAGPSRAMNEAQKVTQFEFGLKDYNAIKYHIKAKIEWELSPNPKTFDDCHNPCSKRLS